MNLLLVGVNHKTAPVELRECLAPAADGAERILRRVLDIGEVDEAFLVSTCNRVELLTAGDGPQPAEAVKAALTDGRRAEAQRLERAFYVHHDDEAVRHLFRVASSLDSLVVGEPQILGQIKESFRLACESGACRAVLNRLLHTTFRVAKRVRSETNIGGAAVSVPFAAVQLAKKIFDDLAGLRALLVGAGEMAELAAEHLLAGGVAELTVANRTYERALALAGRLRGRACAMDELAQALSQSDIVVTSTGAVEPVISQAMAKAALKKRRHRPVFFIDIAVPRDVDPKVAELEGCFVYDIDDLTQVVEQNRASRQEEAAQAELIVAEEVGKFREWLDALAVVPTIAALSAKAEAIRRAEVEFTLRGGAIQGEEQAEAIDRLTRSLVKKLLHDPILFLKEQGHASAETRRDQLALVKRLFGLGPEEG
ncbi:glutamyl-tRNA reductase [Desulfarculus baarsii DSM 2075]|uniref:Glutamyl-tRNA reductase n=1 Tax=Desulfarculus baarsii (strain ATCC 33931 / DSM 2075 / LMG 7858 / VKM B-1802 / 2st14) TaxID=644282 RepID=E1QDS1_DESB2|nr:glutamyl-tRNA reductase [Desulfarculus baarsii]ADK83707.1 glutamyl-tRNA reductase [Desulfarculus baarsii DSM 2075]